MNSLTELKEAMENGQIDQGEWDRLPVFGGSEPESTLGVWSWDETHILRTDSVGNLEIVEREEE